MPVLRMGSGIGPRPHMWSLLERVEKRPPWVYAPAPGVVTFVFFCQWCLATTARTALELHPVDPLGVREAADSRTAAEVQNEALAHAIMLGAFGGRGSSAERRVARLVAEHRARWEDS